MEIDIDKLDNWKEEIMNKILKERREEWGDKYKHPQWDDVEEALIYAEQHWKHRFTIALEEFCNGKIENDIIEAMLKHFQEFVRTNKSRGTAVPSAPGQSSNTTSDVND